MAEKDSIIRIHVNRRSTPGIFGWLFALLSLSLCLLTSLLILFLSSGVYQTMALEQLEGDLLRLDFSRSAALRDAVLAPPVPLRWLAGAGVPVEGTEAQSTSDLIELLDRLNRRDFSASLSLLDNIAPEDAAASKAAGLYELDFALLRSELLRGRELLTSAHLNQATQRRAENTMKLLEAQYLAIAGEFANLLGVKALAGPQEASSVPVYETGVLAGLPRCKAIADNITDLSALKEALQQAEGQVSLSGSDAHLTFQERLNSIRSATAAVLNERRQQQQVLDEITALRRASDLELRRIISGLNNRIRQALIVRLNGKINPYFQILPNLIRWILKDYFGVSNFFAGL